MSYICKFFYPFFIHLIITHMLDLVVFGIGNISFVTKYSKISKLREPNFEFSAPFFKLNATYFQDYPSFHSF